MGCQLYSNLCAYDGCIFSNSEAGANFGNFGILDIPVQLNVVNLSVMLRPNLPVDDSRDSAGSTVRVVMIGPGICGWVVEEELLSCISWRSAAFVLVSNSADNNDSVLVSKSSWRDVTSADGKVSDAGPRVRLWAVHFGELLVGAAFLLVELAANRVDLAAPSNSPDVVSPERVWCQRLPACIDVGEVQLPMRSHVFLEPPTWPVKLGSVEKVKLVVQNRGSTAAASFREGRESGPRVLCRVILEDIA